MVFKEERNNVCRMTLHYTSTNHYYMYHISMWRKWYKLNKKRYKIRLKGISKNVTICGFKGLGE